MTESPEPSRPARISASGPRAVSVGHNEGTIHTGDVFYETASKGRRTEAERRGRARLSRFAAAMQRRVERISELEDWQDERFQDLEAEVETAGRRRGRRRDTLRRVPSLAKALAKSDERIILLEGEPGAGKSVALRHVAIETSRTVAEGRRPDDPIGLYLNLKDFRPSGRPDSEAVHAFIRQSLNQGNDRHIGQFVEEEFDRRLEAGGWLFLFDSFDEIPAVLGSTEADTVVDEYADALHAFLTGMSPCRGVVATREYRGPRRVSWPRFRVLALRDEQRNDLIDKQELDDGARTIFFDGLASAMPSVRRLDDNPLFLTLLCDHVRDHRQFPHSAHTVFETYVDTRLRTDDRQVTERYSVTSPAVREAAELVAFLMNQDPALGLNPARADLLEAARTTAPDLPVASALDALEYMRLGRATETDRDTTGFTFVHRRFQEYFATCYLLQRPGVVAPSTLLTDARWRESCVAVFQLQDANATDELLREADALLARAAADVQALPPGSFHWPPGALHLLDLVQASFPADDGKVPASLRDSASTVLRSAYEHGEHHDRRWVLESSAAADDATFRSLLLGGFASGSSWLADAAYLQVGRLTGVTGELRQVIREMLLSYAVEGRLGANRWMLAAQLRRLKGADAERRYLAFLGRGALIDLAVVLPVALVAMIWISDHLVGVDAELLALLTVGTAGWAVSTRSWTWGPGRTLTFVRPLLFYGGFIVLASGVAGRAAWIWAGTVSVLLLTSWYPALVFLVHRRLDLRRRDWVAPQLSVIRYQAGRLRRLLPELLPSLAVMAGLVLVVVASNVWLPGSPVNGVVGVFFTVLRDGFGLFAIGALIWTAVQRVQDRTRSMQLITAGETLDGPEFAQRLLALRDGAQAQVLQELRLAHHFDGRPETVEHLRHLSAAGKLGQDADDEVGILVTQLTRRGTDG